jgi:hypothetical protein
MSMGTAGHGVSDLVARHREPAGIDRRVDAGRSPHLGEPVGMIRDDPANVLGSSIAADDDEVDVR